MPFVVSVSRSVRASAKDAFAQFSDFELWKRFMPASFRPLSGPKRLLVAGDRLKVALDTGSLKLPITIRVFRVEPPRFISWGGGTLLLNADHRFVFEDQDGGTTLIRSDEEWSGALSRVDAIASRIRRQATSGAQAQLDGFARFIEGIQ